MRVVVGSIHQESNTFSPVLADIDDFCVLQGPALADRLANEALLGLGYAQLVGILTTLRTHGIEAVPVIAADALPGGIVTRKAYERIKAILIRGIGKTGRFDAICLALHGSMYVEDIGHGESDILASVRAVVGKKIPIVAALDIHANVTATMVASADGLVTYRTVPHTDIFETGQRAAELLLRGLAPSVKLSMAFTKLPLLLYGELQQTAVEPMRSLIGLVEKTSSKPHIFSCSLALGDSGADVYNNGACTIVITDGDQTLAQEEADRLALAFWRSRRRFHFAQEAYAVDKAIDIAARAPEKSIFLSDSGDDPTDGAPSDTTFVLDRLLRKNVKNALIGAIYDPEAVRECTKVGAGNIVSLRIGRKSDKKHGHPVRVTGKVLGLHDDRHLRAVKDKPKIHYKLGRVAVVQVKGVTVVLSERRTAIIDPAQLRSLGIEPLEHKLVVLKMGYLFEPFQRLAPRSILMLSPGCTDSDLRKRGFQHVKRPIYPLDRNAVWKTLAQSSQI
jgi:microcystin degradation protein MlrC